MTEVNDNASWAPLYRPYLTAENLTPGVAGALLAECWDDYSQPDRFHHGVGHPSWMLGYLDRHLRASRNPRVIGWTIIMHDRVMDMLAEAPENEERSAILAEDTLKDRLPGVEVDLVTHYIRESARHTVQHTDHDLGIFLDSDMAILGAPQLVFAQYRDNVNQEFWVAMQSAGLEMSRQEFIRRFALGTLAFYASLGSGSIFSTPAAIEEFHSQSQQNIAWDTMRMQQIVDAKQLA